MRFALFQKRYSLNGKTAIVTGGARGLGLEIARILLERGANVAIIARDTAEIAHALEDLRGVRRGLPVSVIGHTCDLLDVDSIEDMLAAVREQLGPIDVLVNNAGAIEVGPLDAMTVANFEDAMKLHCFAPLRLMLGVRDEMRASGGGRIANIASIGGLMSVPHLLPYCTSKFALMGLSQGMRSELARDKIMVSTVAPGLMRTGSPRRAIFKGNHRWEYAWFSISDSLPLLSMSSTRAAQRIVRALEDGDPNVVLGLPAKIAAIASSLMPNLVARALTLANGLLPSGSDPRPRVGFESESVFAPSILTSLTDRAAMRNNEY